MFFKNLLSYDDEHSAGRKKNNNHDHQASLRMFMDLDLINKFNIDYLTLCRSQYHDYQNKNWYLKSSKVKSQSN